MTSLQPIIFTDMDGSLLDHATYSHAEADECLNWLKQKQIPVIPVTSKTCAEVLMLRQQLNNEAPFIVENGAAIYIPLNELQPSSSEVARSEDFLIRTFVDSRVHWQGLLKTVGTHLNDAFLTFQQAGIEGIMQMTGLNEQQAQLAAQREYGEPLKWLGSDAQYDEFREFIQAQGGQLLRGGRFIHLSGACDKGIALQWLLNQYRQHYAEKTVVSIALGDSQNDIAMLEAVDHAIIIRSPVHDYPQLSDNAEQSVYRTQALGPSGWAEGITYVLDKLKINIRIKG